MKPVFPFDSPLIIIPLVLTAAILVFYALFLIKLRPSTEETETTENDSIEPKIEPKETEKPIEPRAPIAPIEPIETIENAGEEVRPIAQARPAETIKAEAHPESIDVEETEKKNHDRDSKKTFFLFGERNFEGCPHKFGHLKNLRKNTPIPDECFGCPQILECLMTGKNR